MTDQLCECGCGDIAPVATKNNTRRGYVKGTSFRFVQGHNKPMLGKKQSEQTRELIRQSRLGELHPLWKGDEASYLALHEWLNKHHLKAGECSACGATGRTEYAYLRHPLPHTRDIDHYAELCRSCHMEFDALLRKEAA